MHISPAAVFRLCYRNKSGNVGFNNSQGQITESGTLKKRKRIASPFPVLPFFRVVVVATTVEGKGHTNRMRKEQQAFLFPFLLPSCGECSQVPRSLPLLSHFCCTVPTTRGGPPILPPLAISEGYEKEKEEWFHVALAASLCRLFLLFPSTPPLPPPGSLNVKDIYLFLTASVVPPLLSLRSMPPPQRAHWPPLLLQVQSPPLFSVWRALPSKSAPPLTPPPPPSSTPLALERRKRDNGRWTWNHRGIYRDVIYRDRRRLVLPTRIDHTFFGFLSIICLLICSRCKKMCSMSVAEPLCSRKTMTRAYLKKMCSRRRHCPASCYTFFPIMLTLKKYLSQHNMTCSS